MSILKLAVGTPITMTVSEHEEVEGQFGPQVKFESENGDCLFVGKDTDARQIERIGGIYPGDTIRFEKVQKGTKTFINFDRVEGGGNGTGVSVPKHSAATTQPAAAPAPASPPVEKGHVLYAKITDYVLATIAPKYKTAGIGLSPEAAAAICATLYIAASKNGGHS